MIVEHYTQIAALRLVNPLNVLARFARLRRGDDDTLAAMLQRDYGPLLGSARCRPWHPASKRMPPRSTAILEEYGAPLALEYDDNDEVHCEICERGARAGSAWRTMRRTSQWKPEAVLSRADVDARGWLVQPG